MCSLFDLVMCESLEQSIQVQHFLQVSKGVTVFIYSYIEAHESVDIDVCSLAAKHADHMYLRQGGSDYHMLQATVQLV